jgi:DNA-binding MarR family transcriptional regulator
MPVATSMDRLQLATRLRLAVTRLNRRLRSEAATGLSASAEAALARIDRHGPLALGELAAMEGVKPPTITAMVAALEADELVSRQPDLQDRRVTRVVVTGKGKNRLQQIRKRKTAYLAARLERLDEPELQILDRAIGAIELLLDESR